MFGTDMLTFQEFMMQGRCGCFWAQAVNAYVGEPCMTQDIDLLSPRAAELAEELRAYLSQ